MKEDINWKQEILASKNFNNKFSKFISDNVAMNYIQEIYIGYMKSRWRKIRELTK